MEIIKAKLEPQTDNTCPLCKSTHPVSEGITLYRNRYECDHDEPDNEDGITEWTDDWCCGCDDECPECHTDVSPVESEEIEIVEAAI